MSQNSLAIGIDLGTTYSCVGIFNEKNRNVDIIPDKNGNKIIPSWIHHKGNDFLVGYEAKNYSESVEKSLFDFKRLIGKKFNDTSVQESLKYYSFEIIENKENGECLLNTGKSFISPVEASSIILKELKNNAELYTGKKIDKAVITVPAYFNNEQRKLTKEAGQLAGLEVIRIINEPTSASMAYGNDTPKNEFILVYDLGGGTLDISLLEISEDRIYEVKATSGNTNLGGEDFDNNLSDYIIKHVGLCPEKLTSKNKIELKRISENAKKSLSKNESVNVTINMQRKKKELVITRKIFEEINDHLFKQTLKNIDNVLSDTNTNKNKIKKIVLIGGSTRIPRIKQIIIDYFELKEDTIKDIINDSINPDEAVAYGAAIHAAVLTGNVQSDIKNTLLVDVIPLSLGIETTGGYMSVIIPRNTPIPTLKKQTFSTYSDNQSSVSLKVYEGERSLTKFNNLLSEFKLTDIPLMPKNVPQIEVKYSVDNNGILTVSACEKSSGNITEIKINNIGKNENTDIKKMLEDHEKNKDYDEKIKNVYEIKIRLENYCIFLKKNKNSAKINKLINEIVDYINSIEEIDVKYESQLIEYEKKLRSLTESSVTNIKDIINEKNKGSNKKKGKQPTTIFEI